MTSTPLRIRDLLLPSLPEYTKFIVDESCARILSNFVGFARFLLSENGISDLHKTTIAASLDALASREPRSTFRMLASPIFRGWYSQFGKVERFNSEDPRLCGLLDSWNNHVHSFTEADDAEREFLVRDGICWCWDPTTVLRVPTTCSGVRVQEEGTLIRDRDSNTILCTIGSRSDDGEKPDSGGSATAQCVGAPAFLPGTGIAVRNDIPPLRLKLSGSLERQTAIADELDREGIGYRDDVDLGTFIEAGELIRHVWPEEYRDFQETLQVVVPREVPYGWRARGMTVSSYQGAIWIMARGLLPIFENLIHEHSHVKLRYIEEYLPILAPEQPETRFVVGWRTDPRPIVGIYEGVYVHLHMLLGLLLLREERCGALREDDISARIDHLATEVSDGVDLLETNARFTPAGEDFIGWARTMMTSACI